MWIRLALRAVIRPRMWLPLGRTVWRFRARDWYRRPPFLPLPPSEYLDWRHHTAYGEEGSAAVEEVERYLLWADRLARGRRGGRTES